MTETPPAADDGFLEAAGLTLERRRIGERDPARPTLVFLHEGLGCIAMWKDFPARVAAASGLPALVFTRAGYAKSDPAQLPRPVDFMHTEGREVLPAVLAAEGLDDVILVGHSDGASISIIATGAGAVTGVRGAVLIAPHVFNEKLCVDSIREAADAYRTNPRLRAGLERYHGDQVDAAFWGWNDVWLDPDFWHWNIEEFLPRIDIPLLLVQGRDDQYGTTAQLDAIERGVSGPCRRAMIDRARHSPHIDAPDDTLKAIVEFVGSLEDGGLRPPYGHRMPTPS